ncbi:unnamed protein product [Meloidogyne enterolobii]|uniref:Uncharacterized protein n=1 Tax=Meloidogyne enterolobii TaxID=390850 RepID=A0ACB1A0F6_MELEN
MTVVADVGNLTTYGKATEIKKYAPSIQVENLCCLCCLILPLPSSFGTNYIPKGMLFETRKLGLITLWSRKSLLTDFEQSERLTKTFSEKSLSHRRERKRLSL